MDLEAFATSPDGLGLKKSDFWAMSNREYRARQSVYDRARQSERRMFAQLMTGLYLEAKKVTGQRFGPNDWLVGDDRIDTAKPTAAKTWTTEAEVHAMMRTQSVEDQKLALRQELAFAFGQSVALKEQQQGN